MGHRKRHSRLDAFEGKIDQAEEETGRGHLVGSFAGGSMTSDTGLLLRRLDQRLSLVDLARTDDPIDQVARPVVHQDTPPLEQV